MRFCSSKWGNQVTNFPFHNAVLAESALPVWMCYILQKYWLHFQNLKWCKLLIANWILGLSPCPADLGWPYKQEGLLLLRRLEQPRKKAAEHPHSLLGPKVFTTWKGRKEGRPQGEKNHPWDWEQLIRGRWGEEEKEGGRKEGSYGFLLETSYLFKEEWTFNDQQLYILNPLPHNCHIFLLWTNQLK